MKQHSGKCMTISIHVPAWGTTDLTFLVSTFGTISIHVPAWGTTVSVNIGSPSSLFQSTFPRGERLSSQISSNSLIFYFNPRSRVGNDWQIPLRHLLSDLFQSTFPRGERLLASDTLILSDEFQSTFPRGERRYLARSSRSGKEFQSTFPRGERPHHLSFVGFVYHFNPRSRVGNDRSGHPALLRITISIHVPAWGTTQSHLSTGIVNHISIHVPAWGTTRHTADSQSKRRISIHVPAWGTTSSSLESRYCFKNFNPRSRVGNDVMLH